MAENKQKGFILFRKDGYFSKTAFILVITWFIVLLRYIVSGFTIFGTTLDYPEAGLTIGLLTAASALYFGNHNITQFKTPVEYPKEESPSEDTK
ncbi:hypothetical protein ACFLSX_04685 [Calditrichota bacterium]